MTLKQRINFSPEQRLDYAKLMVEENYTNKQIIEISGGKITPINKYQEQVQQRLDVGIISCHGIPFYAMLSKLNSILRGWAYAHRKVVVKAILSFINFGVFLHPRYAR